MRVRLKEAAGLLCSLKTSRKEELAGRQPPLHLCPYCTFCLRGAYICVCVCVFVCVCAMPAAINSNVGSESGLIQFEFIALLIRLFGCCCWVQAAVAAAGW